MVYRLSALCVLAVSLLLLNAGCSAEPKPDKLLVFAAASLAESMKQIESSFEAQHPDIDVMFSFGGSGALRQQIEQGAPADVFFSASSDHMEELVRIQLVQSQDVSSFLGNELVVIIPKGAEDLPVPETIEQLMSSTYSAVALGQPETVPAGFYARQTLERANILAEISDKLIYGKDVRSVLTFVETGNADAGFVYKTDALSSEQVQIAFSPVPESYGPVLYPVGIIHSSSHKESAALFITYLQGHEAMRIFTGMGFADLRQSGG